MHAGAWLSSRWVPVRAAVGVIAVVALVLFLPVPAQAVIPPTLEDEGTEAVEQVAVASDRSLTLTPPGPATWSGSVATASNTGFDPAAPDACGKTPETYCDITLVNVVPGDRYQQIPGGVAFSTGGANPGTDLDLYVYASDAQGNATQLVGASGGPTDREGVAVQNATGYFLVVAVYFNVTASGYDGAARFYGRSKVPPDIDVPAGLQDVLVSDPSKGFRSHSEPHLSQDPTNPRILVGGSKFYNRDPDSLAEYEFKIGTFASFDRGQSWVDLGPLNTCPQAQAPPTSWPLGNTCYPEDDPARAGTGPEDATDPRPGGDFGEEYVVSDVWTDFDDEGNAYAMVLDSPPFPSGNGWGMSFHRWETPSAADVASGKTWTSRVPINAYPDAAAQATTLDDKNTFAINNAGPDHDGKTGIIVACWGQNYDLANIGRQQEVCERSLDGGRTWPDAPQPISPPQNPVLPFGPFVIGVHVVADRNDPNTFYAVWLDTLTGFLDGTGKSPLWFTKTTDGAQTWQPAKIVARIDALPGVFPLQGFRNLSLPIMAAGPNKSLYVAYADYTRAPLPGDEDGLQADIKLLRSFDGGTRWFPPKRVNQNRDNSDQFQPYVRVTPRGQVDVSYFDRRLHQPSGELMGNFFIDTWLSRSNTAGRSWAAIRVSHDSWDPSINPPISGSGEFIGDYQGLVADDCYTIPFVNDTHLANPPGRDPIFDQGLPRSPFQEIVAWRVPNSRKYHGGNDDRRTRACRAADQGGAR